MAGKYGSAKVWFLVDGYNLITAKLKGLRAKVEALQEPTHGLGDLSEAHGPTGLSRAEVAQDGGFFDTSTNGAHAALAGGLPTSAQATARVVCLGFAGSVIGEGFLGFEGVFQVAYDVIAQLGNLTKANAEYLVTGKAERGVILHALGAETAAGHTQASSVDYATDDTAQRVIPITSNSQANPTVVTTTVPHGLTSGQKVVISGNSGSSPAINGERVATVLTTTTFSVPIDTSAGSAGTGGTLVSADSPNGGTGFLQVTAVTLGGYDDAVIRFAIPPTTRPLPTWSRLPP